jgi:hypothetical protein
MNTGLIPVDYISFGFCLIKNNALGFGRAVVGRVVKTTEKWLAA